MADDVHPLHLSTVHSLRWLMSDFQSGLNSLCCWRGRHARVHIHISAIKTTLNLICITEFTTHLYQQSIRFAGQ